MGVNIQDLIISGHEHLYSRGHNSSELSLSPKNYAELYTNCVDMGMALEMLDDATYGGTCSMFRSPFGELKLEVKKNVPDDEMWFTISGVYWRYLFTESEIYKRPQRRWRMLRPLLDGLGGEK
jgi:hypothetical protein